MPVSVFPYADFESLLDGLLTHETSVSRGLVLRPIVVPSISFGDALRREISDRTGICMGWDFQTPGGLIHRVAGPGAQSEWLPERMVWKILPLMESCPGIPENRRKSARDQFAMAEILADRFDQYAHFRPEIIRCWARDESPLGTDCATGAVEAERWQRDLWRALKSATDELHPAEQIARNLGDTTFYENLKAVYPVITVVGNGSLDPLLIEVLEILSDAGSHVVVHCIFPTFAFLGDLKRRGQLPDEATDPEEACPGSGHPLVESMGRQAIGSFLLLGKLDDQYTHWPDAEMASLPELEPPSLLGRLQSDIRMLTTPTAEFASKTEIADSSVRCVSCFGPRREMEVVRDEIWRALSEIDGLKPEEIHVVTSDIETYAPLVPAVLAAGNPGLPVRITGRSQPGDLPVLEAMLAILEMASQGRYFASELLGLLQLQSVLAALGVASASRQHEALCNWVRDSGLTSGLGDDAGQWTFARDRMIAGDWLGVDSGGYYPDGTFVLPVSDELGGEASAKARFIAWHAALQHALEEWSEPVAARDWSSRMETICSNVLAGEPDEMLAIRPAISFLRAFGGGFLVDAATICDWLRASTGVNFRRSADSGQIRFGRFKDLQNIPCRVLVMVGMQDAGFPGQNRVPAWDLLQEIPRIWDRNVRIDDRQMFLDAVMVPRDRLIISGSTRNLRTNKDEPFSSCVDELLRVTTAMGVPRDAMVSHQRLQPFAAGYFDTGAELPRSFDESSLAIADTLVRAGDGAPLPFAMPDATLTTPHPAPGWIAADALVTFWKDPARAFLRSRNIFLPRDDDDDSALDYSPMALSALESSRLKRTILQSAQRGRMDDDYLKAATKADRALPPRHLGDGIWALTESSIHNIIHDFESHFDELETFEWTTSAAITVRASIPVSHDRTALLFCHPGTIKSPDHYLNAWIHTVLASATGWTSGVLLFSEGAGSPDELPPIDVDEARRILDDLVCGTLEGQGMMPNARAAALCFAPKTSEAMAKKINAGAVDDDAIAAGVRDWDAPDVGFGGGEGLRAAAQFVWRDADPFENKGEWLGWARKLSIPLLRWRKS